MVAHISLHEIQKTSNLDLTNFQTIIKTKV